MGINSGVFKFVLVLHILASIIGFGAVYLNGLYGAQIKARKGVQGLAIAEANFRVSRVAQFFIYAVFVFGILLVLLSDSAFKFSSPFVWMSTVLYVIGIGISHGLLVPTAERMLSLQRELVAMGPPGAAGGPPPQVLELGKLGARVGIYGTVLDLLLVVILFLMVWRPT